MLEAYVYDERMVSRLAEKEDTMLFIILKAIIRSDTNILGMNNGFNRDEKHDLYLIITVGIAGREVLYSSNLHSLL